MADPSISIPSFASQEPLDTSASQQATAVVTTQPEAPNTTSAIPAPVVPQGLSFEPQAVPPPPETPTQAVVAAPPPPAKKMELMNIVVAAAVIVFITSLAYTVRTFSTRAETPAPAPKMSEEMPPLPPYKFAKSFKSQAIPQSIYTSAKEERDDEGKAYVDDYINTIVMKYYSYKDALAEHGVPYENSSEPENFGALVSEVNAMEELVRQELITMIDFGYVFIPYRTQDDIATHKTDAIKESQAKSMVGDYKIKFDEAPSNSVIDEALGDDRLLKFGEQKKAEYLNEYTGAPSLFSGSIEFMSSLHTQQEGTTVMYTLNDVIGKPYAYVITHVDAVYKKQYASVEELVESKKGLFAY